MTDHQVHTLFIRKNQRDILFIFVESTAVAICHDREQALEAINRMAGIMSPEESQYLARHIAEGVAEDGFPVMDPAAPPITIHRGIDGETLADALLVYGEIVVNAAAEETNGATEAAPSEETDPDTNPSGGYLN